MQRARAFLLATSVVSLTACGEDPQALPPVSYIVVTPADVLIAPADTVKFEAVAIGLTGEPLDVALTYEVDDRSVGLVDTTGLFVATREGVATVSASEPGGVRGLAVVEVAAVTSLTPEHAAFGGVVTVTGAGFGASSELRFGGVPGRIRHVAPDGRAIEAWAPWDARSGAATVRLQDGREVEAPTPFFLTGGGDDALEPNSFDVGTPIDVPFENPYLATRLTSMDHYTFTLFAPTPLTVRVIDREDVNNWRLRVVVQLTRATGDEEFVGVSPAYAFERDARQDAVIARTTLGPGSYRLRVFIGPSNIAVDRRYEIIVDTVADFVFPPDPMEPDDVPLEAPQVEMPFAGTFTLENPWTTDYYALDVTEQSQVHVSAGLGRDAGVFLIDGDLSVTWQLSNGTRSSTFRGVIAPFGSHSFSCTLEPGRYYVGVVDNSGTAGPYDLSIEAEPTTLTFLNCRTQAPGAPELEALRARAVP